MGCIRPSVKIFGHYALQLSTNWLLSSSKCEKRVLCFVSFQNWRFLFSTDTKLYSKPKSKQQTTWYHYESFLMRMEDPDSEEELDGIPLMTYDCVISLLILNEYRTQKSWIFVKTVFLVNRTIVDTLWHLCKHFEPFGCSKLSDWSHVPENDQKISKIYNGKKTCLYLNYRECQQKTLRSNTCISSRYGIRFLSYLDML